MNIITTNLDGVIVFEPKVFDDARGLFLESFNSERYKDAGIKESFVQDNISRSGKDVLRGLHYQLEYPQGKLVTVLQGKVFDVAVDIRQGSPTFGQWHGEILSSDNFKQMYIPPGFAHGFCVLSEQAMFLYKCTEFYHPEDEHSVFYSDASINIDWPCDTPILSEKDKAGLSLDTLGINHHLPSYHG